MHHSIICRLKSQPREQEQANGAAAVQMAMDGEDSDGAATDELDLIYY